jgi:hypothetical protein
MPVVLSTYTLQPGGIVIESHKDQDGREVGWATWATDKDAAYIEGVLAARAAQIDERLAQAEFEEIIESEPESGPDVVGGRT